MLKVELSGTESTNDPRVSNPVSRHFGCLFTIIRLIINLSVS